MEKSFFLCKESATLMLTEYTDCLLRRNECRK